MINWIIGKRAFLTMACAAIALVFFASCKNPASLDNPPKDEAKIQGTYRIGSVLTVDTSGIRSTTGPFSYQWKADETAIGGATNDTYTITGSNAGNIITCTVSKGSSVNVTAQGRKIPYDIAISLSGDEQGDSVSLNPDFGHAGDTITLTYNVVSTNNYNQLVFRVATPPSSISGKRYSFLRG